MILQHNLDNERLHFSVLQGLLMLGYMFHFTEDWGDPKLAVFSVLVLGLFLAIEKYRDWIFLAFISVGMIDYAISFPDLANHSNFNFFIFILLFFPMLKMCVSKEGPNLWHLVLTLRWVVIGLYFFTFFHKLNWDFLNSSTSCANAKLEDYLFYIPDNWVLFKLAILKMNPYLGLFVEAMIPLYLLLSANRSFGIFLVIALHFVLAPMGFTDFSSLAMAFVWTFLDPDELDEEALWKHFTWMASFCLGFELILAPTRFPLGVESYEMLDGFLFILAYTPFLYLYVRNSIDKRSLVFPPNAFYKLALLILIFYGSNNYLGLRTAGNFSMFSNLVTEGEKSNHILLGSNPFKLFHYQEDVVEIIKMDDQWAGFYRMMPMVDQKIPLIEFSRIIDEIRTANAQGVRMTVKYQDKIYETNYAGFDANFDFPVPWIEKKLMKFRFIQKEPPQHCHW